jgi:hypothetical protein
MTMVEHDDVGADPGQQLNGAGAIVRLDDREARVFQRFAGHEANERIVVNEKDDWRLVRGAGSVHAACSLQMATSAARTAGKSRSISAKASLAPAVVPLRPKVSRCLKIADRLKAPTMALLDFSA